MVLISSHTANEHTVLYDSILLHASYEFVRAIFYSLNFFSFPFYAYLLLLDLNIYERCVNLDTSIRFECGECVTHSITFGDICFFLSLGS